MVPEHATNVDDTHKDALAGMPLDAIMDRPGDARLSVKLSSHFADPSAGILLKAGPTYFRVHEWNLKKDCGLFRKIIDPVDQFREKPKLKKLDLKELMEARSLSDRWECPSFADAVDKALDEKVMENPWNVFKAASQIDNVDLAKRCLKAIGHNPAVNSKLAEWNTATLALDFFDGVTVNFVAELIRLQRQPASEGIRAGFKRTQSKTKSVEELWDRIAYKFAPKALDT
ncbi:hypothetical protein M231_05980 [Tremella mesenterica]|uniref:Uncharacterized protein n=1 Tax=Tremella mesenterica TaxID=5217 RepID=A0A4Q1BGP8_TREME|nr:hypothetical protein M231_05980 [Tremella mesenterica]